METDDGTLRLSQRPDAEGSLVAQDPRTGAILALQGGFDFHASKFNRAVQAQRQSGSIFKPFIYLAALQDGEMNAASVVNDAPVVLDDGSDSLWRPVNSSRDFQGPMRLRPALARSRNLVTIRVLQTMGLDHTIQYLEGFGFAPERLAPWPVTGTRQRQPYADGDDQRLRGDRQWWLSSRPLVY